MGGAIYDTFARLEINGTVQQRLESDAYRIICTLIMLPINEGRLKERAENIKNFLKSEYFSNIPHLNISAGIWALTKLEIKKNQFPQNEANARKAVFGLSLDIEHLSIFAPYCDAVFTDKRMAKYLREWSRHASGGYSFKIFSRDNWLEFDAYLDEIENDMSLAMKEELEIAYGD